MLITVTSHKGGVGKTTSAVHLAACLAQELGEGSVALVDTDPNGSALEWAARGEGGLPFPVVGADEEVDAEHVVFDSQGRLHGEDLAAAAEMSDYLVVPTTPDFLALNAVGRFLEDLDEAGECRYRVLLTMVPWYERLYCPGRAELEGAGVPTFAAWIQNRKVFQHAADAGVTVKEVNRKGAEAGWWDYTRVSRELLADLGLGPRRLRRESGRRAP
ncbi:CobQ/CobB/MinD/ParA nucleotide binding domain (plasmid) [Rubrobacter radiotolerans]|uniref:CobQ/CobB/MinD/ParA nucleotide binding domain n=1 Tax=Rubrobacter radiotolerans TaxID=42256 RepID=A0A023X798_RUBRA|nr:ParA family protein [Rubrobacter radiotolerans]AHY48208.1 CobQ/CobB/MinD/ParA nucleotide binding domain [Rubrobacter radiotolerans]MDX5895245.1 ParA family protein [Rubrobacter radiotolerans]SMC01870.1 chromosome partitioning protein [Rubrobacter radiotolerans DSM 5868]